MLHALAICLGACAGALARWRLGLWLNAPGAALPWGTLVANVGGGWLIGLFLAAAQAMPQLDPAWRALVVTGFLGALTTFSAFSAEVLALLLQGRVGAALLLALLHLAGSVLAAWAGLAGGGWLWSALGPESGPAA
ncbi:fluoride efflux transporter CrcB [Melaminivora alkalimesophila]|uniref:Fluoride-specific ion channel FluC n=1 Tax=Melaminivora alkalimesophila TaxID=1165852 RepID=A0A317RGW3_9BURK|nr:fluoride efflux transporter CrcB [Melaminivora alkalimesophila]PWW49007.1 camphor resistance protein CrcB [Melaminivora alkalimesophila]